MLTFGEKGSDSSTNESVIDGPKGLEHIFCMRVSHMDLLVLQGLAQAEKKNLSRLQKALVAITIWTVNTIWLL